MPRSTRTNRKSKFRGNRYTSTFINDNKISSSFPSISNYTSAKKLNIAYHRTTKKNISQDEDRYENDFNFVMNLSILKNIFSMYSSCPQCQNKLSLDNIIDRKMGFCLDFELYCENCEVVVDTFKTSLMHTHSSKKKSKSPGRKIWIVNTRAVIAFREIGKGYAAIDSFALCMNMPPPMTKNNFNVINKLLHMVYVEAADDCTSNAAKETRDILSNDDSADAVIDCQVSLDGTWQKRGHASINGAVTLMSRENGKCIDTYVFSKRCKGCDYWRTKINDPSYKDWQINHICLINHDKSSDAMESAGAVKMFSRSVEKNKLRYTSYIGDGDTSSFNDVVKSQPYGPDVVIDKKECIGHVQKRMGTRLRNMRQTTKGVLLSDDKKIMGKGRLTDKAVNTLHNYYGMAIRQNCENIYTMKKSVWATLYHNSDIEDASERHMFCPRSLDSWCIWQADQLSGANKYKIKLNLPMAITEAIRPIFQDLSKDALLSKCLHGQTQNNNEAINNFIWQRCPKQTYVSRIVIEMAVSSAVLEFNEGCIGLYGVFKKLGIACGRFMDLATKRKDANRVDNMTRKTCTAGIARRKKLRAIRKGFIDKERDIEKVESYSAGAF